MEHKKRTHTKQWRESLKLYLNLTTFGLLFFLFDGAQNGRVGQVQGLRDLFVDFNPENLGKMGHFLVYF